MLSEFILYSMKEFDGHDHDQDRQLFEEIRLPEKSAIDRILEKIEVKQIASLQN
ncbi:MAG: hypothetical protein PHC61_00165 [Chitinivibrionales bacterium]|nr:hypothetical protein [Chitinivibrionales bacterium]